ncbi:MAG: hypothetical protein ABIH71_03295 [Candidatus Omnitrophota bacterium]|nr:hypothetical protein [Candidatus Omnitrophota bacterium]
MPENRRQSKALFIKRILKKSIVYGLWAIVFLGSMVFLGAAGAEVVSLNDALADPSKFDKEIVEVEGEVIGDLLKDKDGVWINILSQGSNIGIFSRRDNLDKTINHWGSYRENGDIVKIRGVFYAQCIVHQEMDIHANNISVSKKGNERKETIAGYKVRLSIIFFIICLTTAVIYFIKVGYLRNKSRKGNTNSDE